jgi:hypothetical protein
MENSEPNIVPVVGHTFEVNFGEVIFQNTFESDTQMIYKPIKGGLGYMQKVNYKSVEIHPNAHFQFWQEEDKTTVSRYVDFEKQVVYANLTLPDNTFLTLKGTIKQID